MDRKRIALVGDYNPAIVAHQGIERSLELARASAPGLHWEWVHTGSLDGSAAERLADFTGIWVVPGSPYASLGGALAAIRLARESERAFLGTCGGFQHAVLEYARNVLHLHRADHVETAPETSLPLISPLACSLVERTGPVRIVEGTRLREVYGSERGEEGYHCSYGLNPAHANLFENGPLQIAARDNAGEVRAVELTGHCFFVATLFQPERRALSGSLHPIVAAFLRAGGA
jgi:CTP synthase (UTP-ammonia lyase)